MPSPVNAQPEAPILAAQAAPEQTPAVTDPADAGMQEIHPAVVETPWMPMETDKIEHIQGVEIQERLRQSRKDSRKGRLLWETLR